MVSLLAVTTLYLAANARQGAEVPTVAVTSNSSKYSSEQIISRFKESLTVAETKGQSIRLAISSLPQGQGGRLNTFVTVDVLRGNILFGHWLARCSDSTILIENKVGELGVSQSGLLRQLAYEVSRQTQATDQLNGSLQDLISEIPLLPEGVFGKIAIWRPELGGNIELNEAANLVFAPGQRFRLQLRPNVTWKPQVAIFSPDGKLQSVYSPEISPQLGAKEWAQIPPDATLGFGGAQKFGSWKVVILLEPDSFTSSLENQVIWGGVVRSKNLELNGINARLGASLTNSWYGNSIRDWRRLEFCLTVKPSKI